MTTPKPRQLTEGRDYLAFQMKAAAVPLADRQKEAVRLYLTRNPEVAPVLNPFVRKPPEERERLIRAALRQCIADGVVAQANHLGEQHRYRAPDEALVNALYAQVVGLDVLETLLQDEEVSSITVINESSILYEKSGRTYVHPGGFESRERMIEVIKNLAIRGGQQLTPTAPTADLAFPPPQVVRIHLSIDPVTPRFGGFMALRRGRAVAWTLEKLVSKGVMDDDVADFLRALMKIPASVIVGGEPASGKTTLLEVMISLLEGQHVCVLEQAAELNPTNRLLSYFEVPPASETISLATLTIDSLRKNAQVVIIGETRGAETGWLLFIAGAMKAIMTTLHGRDSRQVVERLATNAQIQGEPPSPFIGNKELAKQAVANAFDFVIHCTQLPDGRRVVSAIDHIAGVQGETIVLDTVAKAVVDVDEGVGGRKQLHVRWDWSPAWQSGGANSRRWQLPPDLDFYLRMAEVRAEVAHEESGTAGARQHEQYQRACYALDQAGFAPAAQLFAELLQTSPAGYLDAEARLRRALQGLGRWDGLLRQAEKAEQALGGLVRRRQWARLAQALRELESSVELRAALSQQVDLKKYSQVLAQGQRRESDWIATRRAAANLLSRGEPEQAAAALRQVNVSGLSDDLRDEARRLRLEALQLGLQQPRLSGEKALLIYHEMFALADENTEPGLLAHIAGHIRRLEQKAGGVAVDVGQLNVAVFTHHGEPARKTPGDSPEQARHELYLRGVVAMQENRWTAALGHFRQIPEYRQAAVFIKSLEALQQGVGNGKAADVAANA
ncbi:MAG: hypothetical protein FOGNACKC_05476 [Anaerolineae bacterium]|nr:hypothetical protein [Anaerolineae bacterium]